MKVINKITEEIYLLYRTVIAEKKDEVNFWVLIAFLMTFAISRTIVYLYPDLFVSIRGVHIHHFSYGIIFLALVGILALNDWHHKKLRVAGVIYGIALGLAMDEFGMWIRLNDDYWIRHSYDAVFITISILISLVYFNTFWKTVIYRIIKILKST